MTEINVEQLSDELGRSLCRCDSSQCDLLTNDLGLCRALIGMLAQGAPVSAEALAQAAGREPEDVVTVISASGNVELDAQGRIVGAGLSLRPTQHRILLDGRVLYAWCALDALMYPPLLEMDVEVESPCAASGAAVRARVSPRGVSDVTPTQAVVSIVRPEGALAVRQGFCNDVHFFRSAQAAGSWLEAHPQAQLLPVAEAYALGRRLVGL